MTTPWDELGAAYCEMPELFEHLRSKKRQARNYARNKIVDLCGPGAGSTGPARAALPTILALIADPDTPEREGLLLVLADLAAGGMHPDALVPGFVLDGIAKELNALVATHADGAVPCLEDRSSKVRAAAALPLSLVGRTAPLRAAQAREKNATAKGAMVVGLGLIGDRSVCELALEHSKAAVRFGGACGLALMDGPLPPAAVDVLVQEILDGTGVPKSFPWCGGHAAGMAVNILTGACLERGDVAPLQRLFADGSNAKLAAALLRAAFPERSTALRDPSSLSEAERGLLRVVCLSNTSVDETYTALNYRGFPSHRDSLARYAGATPPGPLDTRIDGRPLWMHLRQVLDDDGDVDTVWDRVPAELDLRELVVDATGNYMSLQLPFPRRAPGAQLATARGHSKLASLSARLLETRADAAFVEAWMTELLDEPQAASGNLCEALLGAWESLAQPDGEAIARFLPLWERAIGAGSIDLLRPLIARVDLPSRAAVILGIGPRCHFARHSQEFCYDGCLPYLDLVPTAEAADVAVGVVREHWGPPLSRVGEILRAMGPVAQPAIDKALADPDLKQDRRAFLTEVRGALGTVSET